jgi:uncharacterized protein with GYD domain
LIPETSCPAVDLAFSGVPKYPWIVVLSWLVYVPKYICFFSYTCEAANSMIERPTDRVAAAREIVESVGGRMECFYWMQGDHDGFLIAEYKDAALAAAVAMASRARALRRCGKATSCLMGMLRSRSCGSRKPLVTVTSRPRPDLLIPNVWHVDS